MYFRSARAQHFRLLRDARIELHPELNYVVGGNGAGKTTLLESLHVLGRGSSHRCVPSLLTTDGEAAWALEARIADGTETAPPSQLRVRWVDRRTSIELDGSAIAISELVRKLPVLLLDPGAHRILEEGPGIRRRYIDWGVFHMEHRFHSVWTRMSRALRQRNAGLRSHAPNRELLAWDRELVTAAEDITVLRRAYLDRLEPVVRQYWARLLSDPDWQLRFHAGWRDDQPYAEVLARNLEGDRKIGHTREGPHRAELQILSDNRQLKDRVSRGQQKMLVAALILAQCELYRQQHGAAPVLLLDDLAAELSRESQALLLAECERYAGQKVIAALEYSDLLKHSKEHCMFHMEHGHIKQMS